MRRASAAHVRVGGVAVPETRGPLVKAFDAGTDELHFFAASTMVTKGTEMGTRMGTGMETVAGIALERARILMRAYY